MSTTVKWTHLRPLSWFSDGWHGYRSVLRRAYRQPLRTSKQERPRLAVPETLTLTQIVKHRDEHGRLLSVETRRAGASRKPAWTVHIERRERRFT